MSYVSSNLPVFLINHVKVFLMHNHVESSLIIYPTRTVRYTDSFDMHSSQDKLTSSIAVIGAGDVGASIAYSLLLNPVAHDVILVDLKEELLEAQVRDLGDATFRGNAGVRVKKGTFEEAGQADVIVITAGAKQKKGKSDLIVRPMCPE